MSGLTNKLFGGGGASATEVPKVAAAVTDVSGRADGTSALEQQRKNKKKFNFAATQGSVTSGETFGV